MLRFLVSSLLLWAASPVVAQIEISPESPIEGDVTSLRFPAPIDTLEITYRPESVTSTSETLVLDGATSAEWTPTRAGVVQLAFGDQQTQNVSVRYRETSGLGLFVMIVAGMILFGGIGFAFRSMLSNGDESAREMFMGDT